MTYNPVSGFTIQTITKAGEIGSDYYLKFYEANTTTPLSMATDGTGSTLLSEAKLGDKGMPISNPLDNSTVFIPYVDQNYRLVIYTSKADADADDTASAFVNIASVEALVGADQIGTAGFLDTGTASDQVPTNGDLGTAAQVDTGTAADQVPTNGDLGTAAQADTGTASGEIPTADDLGVVGETNYHSGNVNLNEFGGIATNDDIIRGFATSSTTAAFYAPLSSVTAPASITVTGTFSVLNATTTLSTGVSSFSLAGSSSNKLAVITCSISGATAGEVITLRTSTSSSKITVNF